MQATQLSDHVTLVEHGESSMAMCGLTGMGIAHADVTAHQRFGLTQDQATVAMVAEAENVAYLRGMVWNKVWEP